MSSFTRSRHMCDLKFNYLIYWEIFSNVKTTPESDLTEVIVYAALPIAWSENKVQSCKAPVIENCSARFIEKLFALVFLQRIGIRVLVLWSCPYSRADIMHLKTIEVSGTELCLVLFGRKIRNRVPSCSLHTFIDWMADTLHWPPIHVSPQSLKQRPVEIRLYCS